MHNWIFDIDGVLNDPEKKISDPMILEIIAQNLSKGEPHIFITGRASKWVIEKVLLKLEEIVKDKRFLSNVFALAEFGADRIYFEENKFKTDLDKSFSLPEDLIKEAERITQEKFSDISFVDHEKKVQFTSEVNDNIDIEKIYKPVQKKTEEEYQKLIKKYRLENELEVHADRAGTNIKSKKLNKLYATKIAIDWTRKNQNVNDKFIVFGDSIGDLDIGLELYNQKLTFDFIFVGGRRSINRIFPFPIQYTKELFYKGTLESLQKINHV